LTRTFMFSNGYYSCKYYICTCPIPSSAWGWRRFTVWCRSCQSIVPLLSI
jgi:hypothetical protein